MMIISLMKEINFLKKYKIKKTPLKSKKLMQYRFLTNNFFFNFFKKLIFKINRKK